MTKILIIGGGASGVLLACNLLRHAGDNVRVTLIEKSGELGRGVAFSGRNDSHVLNVRASNMSAFPDEPDHFWRWLLATGMAGDSRCSDPYCFAPRHIYGRYLQSLIEPLVATDTEHRRLHIVHGECRALNETASGVVAEMADGSSYLGHVAVLATGNEAPGGRTERPCESGWSSIADMGLQEDDPVLIIGTGLTMVDHVMSLMDAGHKGLIHAVSRRGLVPQPHLRNQALHIDLADIPLGTNLHYFMRWFRRLIGEIENTGGNWRDVLDGLRPHTQMIWQSWTPETRQRFLRHARAWWDVHRHRMNPDADTRIKAAIATGRLRIEAGRVTGMQKAEPSGVDVTYVPRGAPEAVRLHVSRVIDCTGVVMNPADSANPVLQGLLKKGRLRPDPVGIGLDITPEGAVIDRDGRASERLYAVGPITRAAFWEIVAIPDIRLQCAQLASRLLGKP